MNATVDIVIPVYNEEQDLPQSMAVLTGFLEKTLPNPWRVIIADNASTDNTRAVSERLCTQFAGVSYLHIPRKGKGLALRTAWMASTADIVSYMDADLSTDLRHLPQLVQALEEGHNIAIGSRLSAGSRVQHRSLKREFISRSYNLLVRSMFFTSFQDAQCGFKALTRQTAQAIIPKIEDNKFFFDTELLIIAAKRGYRIKQVPVEWKDDPNSTVNVVGHSADSIKGLFRLRFGGIPQVSPPDNLLANA